MSIRRNYSDFAALFKKYRLKSEIETLSEFGNLLAEEGYIYEDSLFTRWQKGERIPKDRRVLLTIIELFAKRGGINNIIEANRFLESTDSRDLNEGEILEISSYFDIKTQTLPAEIDIFVGRQGIMQEIIWKMLSKEKVLLYGMPGVGKTAIGIRVGHILKNQFTDGVFWFRADIKQPEAIVDETLRMIGIEDSILNSYEKKLKRLNQAMKQKNIILILDNLNINTTNSSRFMSLLNFDCAILITSNKPLKVESLVQIKLPNFSPEEYKELAEKILGKPYVLSNSDDINELGRSLDHLPITTSMLLKQLFSNPKRLKNYISEIERNVYSFQDVKYDDKNLHSSLEVCLNELPDKLQKILASCSIFEGNDFDIRAVSYINSTSPIETKTTIEKLIQYSFINLSTEGRYRMNPSVRIYLYGQINKLALADKLVAFYNKSYQGKIIGDKVPLLSLDREIDNILGLVKLCFNLKLFNGLLLLWEYIHNYLWLSGKWTIILSLDSLIQKSFIFNNDRKGLGYYLVEDLGRINFFLHKNEDAINCLIEASKIAGEQNSNFLKGIIFQKYGISYTKQGRFEEGEIAFNKSLNLLKNDHSRIELIKTHIFYGDLLVTRKKFLLAKKYLTKALKESIEHDIEDTLGISYLYLGNLYLQINKYFISEKYFKKAVVINKRLKRKIGLALAYDGLFQICKKRNDILITRRLAKLAFKIYDELGMKTEAKNLRLKT